MDEMMLRAMRFADEYVQANEMDWLFKGYTNDQVAELKQEFINGYMERKTS